MGESYKFALPCYAHVNKRKIKKIPLNLNWYRNAHHMQCNLVKHNYCPDPLFEGHPGQVDSVTIRYTLFLATNRRTDVMNWVSIADKFFCDWLVDYRVLADDDWRRVTGFSAEVKPPDENTKINWILAEVFPNG